MALSRLAARNLLRRALSGVDDRSKGILRHLSASSAPQSEKSGEKEVSVSDISERPKSSLKKRSRRFGKGRDLVPFGFNDLFRPLQQATENLNRLFGNLTPSLFSGDPDFFGRVKEDDKSYKLRFEVPGLNKDEIKIMVEDGCLIIRGEHKEEREAGSDSEEEEWTSGNYRYYSTSLLLPDDAKVDELKAELKNGVLYLTVPKSETHRKDVKVVEIEG